MGKMERESCERSTFDQRGLKRLDGPSSQGGKGQFRTTVVRRSDLESMYINRWESERADQEYPSNALIPNIPLSNHLPNRTH